MNAPVKLDAMKVVRDKDTGKLRAATSEEIVEMDANATPVAPHAILLSRPVTTYVTRADGGVTVRRSMDEMDSLTATRTPDGKVTMRHGDKQHAPATQPKE